MKKGNLTRGQVIKIAGIEAVKVVEKENCDFTNRVQCDADIRSMCSDGFAKSFYMENK